MVLRVHRPIKLQLPRIASSNSVAIASAGRMSAYSGPRGDGRCAADGGAAEDGVAVVQDRRLAPGHAARGVVQADAHRIAVQPGRAGLYLAVGAELDEAVAGFVRRCAAGPDPARRGDLGDVEALGGAHRDRPGHRLDVEHVAGPAVTGGGADPQATALADREGVSPFVRTDDGAGLVDDVTGFLA